MDQSNISNNLEAPPRRYPLRVRTPAQKPNDGFNINSVNNRDSIICPTLNQALHASVEICAHDGIT